MLESLLPRVEAADDAEAVTIDARSLTYEGLARAAGVVAQEVVGFERAALLAVPALETCVGLVGALAAGVAVVPINPASGERELQHVVNDSAPGILLAPEAAELPETLRRMRRLEVSLARTSEPPADTLAPEATALILYTSGTTGPPKGAMIPKRAISSNLDALAVAWAWTDADLLAHALPLFHVHGLVLGVLGPLRRGARLAHAGSSAVDRLIEAVAGGASMVFGVPTTYVRIGRAAEADPIVAETFAKPRLLVSGSAPLPQTEYRRIHRLTGQRIVERYGLTETLINTSVRASGDRRPGYVGPPLDGVELTILDEDGRRLEAWDDETMGEVAVKGPNVFNGYLNRPVATAEVLRDGWFFTGDLGTRARDGSLRIVGRRALDLIKSGGYKIAAGEVELALLEHEDVAEAAVTGWPDDDLGERVVAWVVLEPDTRADSDGLSRHVGTLLAPHKRPREVVFVSELPRNAMGKVLKGELRGSSPG